MALLFTFTSALLFALTVMMTMQRQVVMGDRMIRFIFNDGITPSPSNECTEADNRLIDPLFKVATNLRSGRQLLDEILADDTGDLHDHENLSHNHRELYPARCRDSCAGLARGTCRATGCLGYRRWERKRELSSIFRDLAPKNQQQRVETTSCDTQVNYIHQTLDNLIMARKFTAPCILYLTKSKRKSECYDDAIYGEILGFTFYNMNIYNSSDRPVSAVIGTNITNGYTICNSMAFDAEVNVNPCVRVVNFTMTGPNNFKYDRVHITRPSLLFNITGVPATYGGRYLSTGKYSLSATPDNFANKQKKLDFTVITC
jgi:hypothetical protein